MFQEFDHLWSKPAIPEGQKMFLTPFLNGELADQISKCTITQVKEILRANESEILEVLIECYENASETKMVEYVWNFITPNSKFNDVKFIILKIAETVEKNWSKIIYQKLTAEDEAKIEKLMNRKRSTVNEDENRQEPPPKKSVPCDPRRIDPVYVPPRSLFDDEITEARSTTTEANIPTPTKPSSGNDSKKASRISSEKRNSVGFSTSAERNRNRNGDHQEKIKSPPPSQLVTEEEVDDDESVEAHIPRARNASYYARFASKSRSSPTPKNRDTEHIDDNGEQSEESEDDFHHLPPRNLYRYLSTSTASRVLSTRKNALPPTKSMFDAVSTDDEDEEDDVSVHHRKLTFEEAIEQQDNTNKKSAHSGNAYAASLQPHDTLDFETKVNMEGIDPCRDYIGFPNQRIPVRRPTYDLLENWVPQTNYKPEIRRAIDAFCNYQYREEPNKPSKKSFAPEHLFIYDAMLYGIPFKSTYKKIETIECGYPNDPLFITDYLKTEIEARRNDYIIKNIFICIGFDLISLDPDDKRAMKNATKFIERMLNIVIKAFDPRNGPKRYRCNEDGKEIDAIPPKLIFITIPQVKASTGYNTYNAKYTNMNNCIRKCVEKGKTEAERKRVVMELYDWEKTAEKFDKLNEEHLRARHDVLMTHLSTEYGLLMYPPEEKSDDRL